MKCEITDTTEFLIPKKVDYELSATLHRYMTEHMKTVYRKLRAEGWTFYVVDQVRGRCYYRSKAITIPIFALKRTASYAHWYLSHEMAHTQAIGDNHGDRFMTALRHICPPEAIHHELGYKPRNASRNGIIDVSEL